MPNNTLQLALFSPETDWTPPERYPDLSGAKRIAVDVETRDPNLKRLGPGGVRGDGEVVGFSVATDTGFSGYFPIRHMSGGNLDPDTSLRWLNDTLRNPDQIKIGANFIYDLEWLAASGVEVKGPLHDVQIIEGLLDEEGTYNLNFLSNKYLGRSKDEELLNATARSFGIHPKSDMWKLHSKYVGPYGEADALNTLDVYEKQLPLLQKQDLGRIFTLESELTPVLLKMRMRGVRVDLERAEELNKSLKKEYEQGLFELSQVLGFPLNIWSASHLTSFCEKIGVQINRTAAGNPSFVKDWFENHPHPKIKFISHCRGLDRLRGTFIESKIIKVAHNGRVHTQFHQMKNDEGGTRTGRFSSSNPNLQQVPARSTIAPKVRALFIPEPGEKWAKLDYSQQEPRLAVHYARICNLNKAQGAVEAYQKGSDFYKLVQHVAGIERSQSKTITLGRMYGMGLAVLAEKLHLPAEAAQQLLDTFDNGAPFLRQLAELTEKSANRRGYITTMGGRRRHFNLWRPASKWQARPLPIEEARAQWGSALLVRADTRKALNSLVQGSAADMIKRAIVDVYKETGHVPLITVHDEGDYSLKNYDDALVLKEIFESAAKLVVPLVCDLDFIDHWK